ncbi:MAG: SLBB domain-containing protein, partial [Longimicrobiales bacterium]
FTRGSSQFQPLLSGPVPDDYRLGPGDQMVLVLTGEVELAHELEVTRGGTIVIPEVGQLSVANLKMSGLRTLLRKRLARSYSGISRGTTDFDVTISELGTNQIYVTGEVQQAGAYQLSSVATVLNALYAADGPTELGSLRDVRVQRRTGEELTLDLYPYLLEGDVSGDVMLEQGDVVFVPLRGRRVNLSGAVVRPAHYELDASDDLVEVLRAAGGFAPDARRERLTIHRVLRPGDQASGTNRIALDLGFEATPESAPGIGCCFTPDSRPTGSVGGVTIPPIGLQDGDSIVVDTLPGVEGGLYVTIGGLVESEGRFPWHDGMTVRDLVLLARGPIVGADLREAEVSRLPSSRGAGELATLLRVPLDSSYLNTNHLALSTAGPAGVAFAGPGTAPEFALRPFDEVQILQQPDFEMQRMVAISGEVPVPGHYALESKTDRVTDLLERAGGLLPTAYVEGARLVRGRDNLGGINLDLAAAMATSGDRNNLTLEPGDSLHIPVYSPTITVRGAVNSPLTVLYEEGRDLEYYVENAGGFRHDADRDRLSVRYANGQAETRSKFLFWSSDPKPLPGSTIAVPAQDPADRFDTRGLVTDLVAILGSLTTVVVVLAR